MNATNNYLFKYIALWNSILFENQCVTHGHERHGPFTRLVGLWWFESSWVTGFNWFGLWYAAGAKPVCMVLCFGYRWDACELCWFWLQVGCL
jgi:hypothetical protein